MCARLCVYESFCGVVCVCVCVCVHACECVFVYVFMHAFQYALCMHTVQGHIQTAAKLTSRLYRKVMLPAIESAMESDKKVKQSSITEKMDKALDNLEKYGIKVEASLCLYMLTPVVQSGGKYDLDIVHVKP